MFFSTLFISYWWWICKPSCFLVQFATRAKTIVNTATVNEILSDEAMLQRYKKELNEMKKMIAKVRKFACFVMEPAVW